MQEINFQFIDKTAFFPEKGILVIGDLHIGYDYSLIQSGILIPERQVKEIIGDLKVTFSKIKKKGYDLKKIVFLGDIKHSFSYEPKERNEFHEVLEFLRGVLPEENIILIKGNHDTIDYTFEGLMKEYYLEGDMAFLHGNKSFPEIFDKKIKIIVMGHLHPSIILEEKPGVKKEDFKCFLQGRYKKKTFLVVPSFLNIIEGSNVNEYASRENNDFSIVPKKALLNFNAHVIGKEDVYDFGKVRDL